MTRTETNTGLANTAAATVWGDHGPTLVFLHYFSGAAASWQWVADLLKDRYRCVALNLPGFGGTPPLDQPSLQTYADWVMGQIDGLDLATYSLVGHSMGGKIALKIAADATGDRLQQLVLVAPSPATREPMPNAEKQRLLQHHPSRENAETTVKSATLQPLTAEQRSLAIQTHTMSESSAWRWWLLEGMDEAIADPVNRIGTPTTVIASADDPVIPLDVICRDVVDRIPAAELVEVSGVGHLIPLEAPQVVVQQVQRLLAAP